MSAEQPGQGVGAGGARREDDTALPLRGPDLVRAALSEAKAAARAKGAPPPGGRRRTRAGSVRSTAGPEGGDPVPFGAAVRRLVAERGWEQTSTAAGVLANWPDVVGPEIADHCQPVGLVDGHLVLVAQSSAWATQLRLLRTTVLARITEHAGAGVVRTLEVRGPAQPDWRRGPRRVQGRGPRDTYG